MCVYCVHKFDVAPLCLFHPGSVMNGMSIIGVCGRRQIRALVIQLSFPQVLFLSTRSTIDDDEIIIRSSSGSKHYETKNISSPFSLHHTSPSRSVEFSTVKHGIGKIVATVMPCNGNAPFVTQLSTVSHKSPVRLIPTTTTVASRAKQVSVGHYGGGMAKGDSASVHIHVQKHSRLHVRTQGINRVYGHGNKKQPCRQRDETIPTKVSTNSVDAVVDEHGLLVYAPDPVSLHSGAQYHQTTNYMLKDPATSNLVAIDWICSGRRYSNESEHWYHKSCATRTTVRFQSQQQHDQSIPTIIDAQSITAEGMSAFASTHQQLHTIATVILSGSMVVDDNVDSNDSIVKRFLCLQSAFVAPYTAVRRVTDELENCNITSDVQKLLNEQLSVGGRVVIGVSKANTTINTVSPSVQAYTVRIAATSNEDIYRILHYCMLPLAPYLDGIECYKDRIVNASRSPRARVEHLPPQQSNMTQTTTSEISMTKENSILCRDTDLNHSNYWTAFMLADSALPIGSFAHSSGIEVASQLGFLRSSEYIPTNGLSHHTNGVAAYVRAAVISTMQLSTPFLWCSSSLTSSTMQQMKALKLEDDVTESQQLCETFDREYRMLDSYAQAALVTNGPSCRASIDQGRNLLRVAQSALVPSSMSPSIDEEIRSKIILMLERAIESSEFGGHIATVLGVVTRVLQLNAQDAVRLYGYCVSRDVVNAAVRLNLIGPMEGQRILLRHAKQASADGINRAETAIRSSLFRHSIALDDGLDHVAFRKVLETSIGSAPMFDTIHPCHDVLATRLFRT